jgi:hypothetical protein
LPSGNLVGYRIETKVDLSSGLRFGFNIICIFILFYLSLLGNGRALGDNLSDFKTEDGMERDDLQIAQGALIDIFTYFTGVLGANLKEAI